MHDESQKGIKVDEKKDFEISYNPDTTQGFLGDLDGGPETALVMFEMPCGKDGHLWTGDQFFILKGDFRKECSEIMSSGGGRWECKTFYDQHKAQFGSRWFSDFSDWGKDGLRRKRGEPLP